MCRTNVSPDESTAKEDKNWVLTPTDPDPRLVWMDGAMLDCHPG